MTGLADSRARRGGRARELARTEGPAAARIVVTVTVAWQVALWLGADQPPVFAAIVPLVALRGDPMTALGTSLRRTLGVVAGVVIGIVVLNVLSPSTVALALVVALGLGVGMVLRAGGGLNIQVAASSLLVFASTSPDAYALHRVWETAEGAAVTILLAPLLWPPDPHRILGAVSEDCRARLAQALTGTAAALRPDRAAALDNLSQVNADVEAVHAGAARAREAERAMRFNPLRRRQRETVRLQAQAIDTADRLAAHVATWAGEVAVFAGREDLAADLVRAGARLPEPAALTARAIGHALSGGDPLPAVATARTGLAAYARADSRPVAVALRRPLHRILDELDRTSPRQDDTAHG
ncbi:MULTISPECIES: FUSC family protein [unclassified Streptomyces]|uniref:FUSC family protein n=1 Tax=unclassified Streptomyces TaxID=2593676 RepID=UPI0013A6C99A|nr:MULTISPECIES: FUSC family protein [unclassified Streptomyces]